MVEQEDEWSALLAGAALAYADPGAAPNSPPRWRQSQPVYERVWRELSSFLPMRQWQAQVLDEYTPSHRELFHELRRALQADAGREPVLKALADEARPRLRLYYHEENCPYRRSGGSPVRMPTRQVRVVIPFRAREDQRWRARNLRMSLAALSRQTAPEGTFSVTLVESDAVARNRDVFEGQVDNYIHHIHHGPFNKAAAVNAAGEVTRGQDVVLCILDADVVVERDFISAVASTLRPGILLIPYWGFLCLDAISSAAAIAALRADRLEHLEDATGYVLPDAPGGCIVIEQSAFDRLNGFDTRFEGWGGEDRDFVTRASSLVDLKRTDTVLLHLMHERPAMDDDYEAIMRNAYGRRAP